MRSPLPLRLLCGTAVLVGLCGLRAEASEPIPNRTGDGVVLINQNRAVNGGVTPGDAPGFPITISRPGSYRLASNLNASGLVIEIVADGVSLDLNGFSIIGPGIFGP